MEAVSNQACVLQQVYVETRQRFEQVIDLAHGWEHVSRVYKLALHIAERENADRFIVGMAVLMHDLGRTVSGDDVPGHHADASAYLAQELLCRYKISEEQQQAIIHAIVAHSFSRGVEPLTLEARVVRDADRLDGLGAIGIMRWAMVGDQRCTAETLSHYPDDPLGELHQLDDRKYLLDHYYLKLFKLAETMTTETGKALARRRTAFMHTYIYEFVRELELL